MKRLFVILLSLCMILSVGTYSVAAEAGSAEDENVVLLSSLDNEECKQFLLNQGVTIPEEFSDLDFQQLIALFEANPNGSTAAGYTPYGDLLQEIKDVVNVYYGYIATPSSRTSESLQHSIVYSWDNAMLNYNCYAYALGRTYMCYIGDFSNNTYDDSASITDVALMVKEDLNGDLGYDCVKVQSSRPTSTGIWSNVIAVRKDTTGDGRNEYNDYHFAKLTSSGWCHKPGPTAVLKFISAPSNSVEWTNEAFDGGYIPHTITYDSNIMYLLYKSNHGSTTYTYTGEHYHSGSNHYYLYAYICNDCGDRASTVWSRSACSGPPCITPSSIIHEAEES